MNYYNENDPKAAAWLRALMAEGHIPDGTVDAGSISDVRGTELSGYTQCHFFAGIAGWSEALRLAGWPADMPVWTGSCPCQPFSVAGKRKGESDERHLWPEFRRLVSECRPPIIFGEQVASAAGRAWLAGVRADLEALGYAVGAADLCAASVGAPHIRQRLYWVAYSHDTGPQGWNGAELRECAGQRAVGAGGSPGGLADAGGMGNAEGVGRIWRTDDNDQGRRQCSLGFSSPWSSDSRIIQCLDGKSRRIPIEPEFFPLAHGVPGRVGLLRGYGNAIVPQVAADFIKAATEAIASI